MKTNSIFAVLGGIVLAFATVASGADLPAEFVAAMSVNSLEGNVVELGRAGPDGSKGATSFCT